MVSPESDLEISNLSILSRHPIFELSDQNPVFIINEKVYVAGEAYVGSDMPNFFQDKNNKKTLVEIGDINSFDELHYNRESENVSKLSSEYASEVRKRLNSLKSINSDLDVPQMIYRDIFPYLREEKHKNKLLAVFGQKTSKANKDGSSGLKNFPELERIIGNICKEVSVIKSEVEKEELVVPKKRKNFEKRLDNLFDYRPRKEYTGNSIFGKAINVTDVVLTQGRIYELIPGFDDDFSIVLNGRNYSTGNQLNCVAETEKRYLDSLRRRIKSDSLKENFSKEKINEILGEHDIGLLSIRGKKEYFSDGFGFTMGVNGYDVQYFVYVDLPEFAIKSQFDGNYYFFNKSKIGLFVNSSNSRLISYAPEFFMVENNNHPFIYPDYRNSRTDFVKICIGKQPFPTSGKNLGEVIAKRLRTCKNMLMYGYKEGTYPPCDQLRVNDYFRDNVKEKSELERKGILIIPGGGIK